MKLALNTFVYEVAEVPILETIERAKKFQFNYVDLAAYKSGDPTNWSKSEKGEFLKRFKDTGLISSQMLLVNTENIASSNHSLRRKTSEYMKECAGFQLELGGKQVLICWGCGVYEINQVKEAIWMNAVSSIREYARWCLENRILVELELDPHVYFLVNNLERMSKMIEDVDMPNVFPNIDVGHLCLTREGPKTIEKFKDKILHVHLSETDTYSHTNSILGTGSVDFKSYVDKVIALGIEETCERYNEIAVAGIELGELEGKVDNPDRWIDESLKFLKKSLPVLTL